MDQGRQKKKDERDRAAGGKKILLPEVFTSCQMKQQRNYVQYKRNKNRALKAKSDV
jgi:hypothetical protein